MTHLDPDPLYVADDEEPSFPWPPRKVYISSAEEASAFIALFYDEPTPGNFYPKGTYTEPRSAPSLTIPLVLLCAVVGAVFVAWLVTR